MLVYSASTLIGLLYHSFDLHFVCLKEMADLQSFFDNHFYILMPG